MHSDISTEMASAGRPSHAEPDKVSMHFIRLALSRQRNSAKVGSFHAADQVLLSWAARSYGTLACEFEIVYDDGHTLAGEFRFQSKASRRPALMGFVRRAIKGMSEGSSKAPLVRGLCNDPQAFLADYATDDG